MTDESKPKIANLELNRETVADLTEEESHDAKGGRPQTGHGCDTDYPCCWDPPYTNAAKRPSPAG
jgi:hypothetical protein